MLRIKNAEINIALGSVVHAIGHDAMGRTVVPLKIAIPTDILTGSPSNDLKALAICGLDPNLAVDVSISFEVRSKTTDEIHTEIDIFEEIDNEQRLSTN